MPSRFAFPPAAPAPLSVDDRGTWRAPGSDQVAELQAALRAAHDALAAAQAELRAREARFRAAVTGMEDGFLVLHAVRERGAVVDFEIVEMNDTARALLGAPHDDAEPITLRSIAPSAERSGLLRICREVIASGRRCDVEHRAREPRTRAHAEWMRVQAFPLDGDPDALAVVARDITARKLGDARLRDDASRAANRDALTGLLDRRGFQRAAARHVAAAAPVGRPDVLLHVDVDDFAPINETYGHAVGDDALRTVAAALRGCVRGADLVARFGGDEFVVYAPAGADALAPRDAALLVRRVRDALAHENARAPDEGRPFSLAATVVAVTLATGESLDELLARAEQALYAEKRQGGLIRR